MTIKMKDGVLKYTGKLDSQEKVKQVIEALQNNPKLTGLDLSGCDITNEVIRVLVPHIEKHPALFNINLSNNAFTDTGALLLVNSLRRHHRRIVLDMTFNFIVAAARKEIESLTPDAKNFACKLSTGKMVRFPKDKLLGFGFEESSFQEKLGFDFKQLASNLQEGQIWELKVEGPLNDIQLSLLIALLEQHNQFTHLRKLNFGKNNLSKDSITPLHKLIAKCTHLREITLESSDPAMQAYFQFIENLVKQTLLDNEHRLENESVQRLRNAEINAEIKAEREKARAEYSKAVNGIKAIAEKLDRGAAEALTKEKARETGRKLLYSTAAMTNRIPELLSTTSDPLCETDLTQDQEVSEYQVLFGRAVADEELVHTFEIVDEPTSPTFGAA